MPKLTNLSGIHTTNADPLTPPPPPVFTLSRNWGKNRPYNYGLSLLYTALALLVLSGGALAQTVENSHEITADSTATPDSATVAAQEPEKELEDGRALNEQATPEPDGVATAVAQKPDNIPVADTPVATEQPIPQTIQQTAQQPTRSAFYMGIGANIAGLGILGIGLYEEMNVRDLIAKGKFPAAESAETVRNTCYIIGALFLAAGISIHIFF